MLRDLTEFLNLATITLLQTDVSVHASMDMIITQIYSWTSLYPMLRTSLPLTMVLYKIK